MDQIPPTNQNKVAITNHKKALDMISNQQRNASYKKVMQITREHLTLTSRVLSTIIHVKFIEKTIEILSQTLLRPNSMLFGSILALTASLISFIYVFYYEYTISNLEIILSFGIGWLIGIIYDYLKLLISGK